MALTIAFDVYGTLLDMNGAHHSIAKLSPNINTERFAATLRQKQLEYTFRQALMGQYTGFDQCTRDAIDYCCALFEIEATERQKHMLMDAYAHLPAYGDVRQCLSELSKLPVKLVTFSNAESATLHELLSHASIESYFDQIISVDAVASFKPDPKVYHHLIETCKTSARKVYLVSGNAFDLIGANAVGIKTIWCQRSQNTHYDPWGGRPDHTLSSLQELAELIRTGL